MSVGLRQTGTGLLHQDQDCRYDLAENLPSAWPVSATLGLTDAEILPPDIAELFTATGALCRSSQEEQSIEFHLSVGKRRQLIEARFVPDGDGLIIVLVDVTDERSREAAVNALLREVSHRSKNLLAIVQSVAMQTARHSDSIQDFLDKFRGRLHALSSTQDLVTESNWQGTHFQSLVTSQLSRVVPSLLRELRITGDNPLLGPNAALHIGLAIHELAANAVIHGALSTGSPGHVWVDARIETRPGRPRNLTIEWQETGIETGKSPQPPRFGTMVLERIVPLSVGGKASFSLDQDHLSYRLTVPGDQFEI
ncbi:sensor histidine kinase [Devosia limi]|nr:sensor histidine kinase [Devosia limi]